MKSVLIGLAVTILGTMPTLASVKDIENQNTLNSHEVMVKIYDIFMGDCDYDKEEI